jgi:hypothetical protein
MANSTAVVAGTVVTAAQYNALRDDAIDATTGHDHSGAANHGPYIGLAPIGVIILWSGAVASIPTNWQICNGTNGTPDLRNRFVIGAGSTYAVNAVGGSASKDLSHVHASTGITLANESTHTHSGVGLSSNLTGAHSHAVSTSAGAQVLYGASSTGTNSTTSSGDHSHSVSGDTAAGSAHTHTLSGNTASSGSATQDIMPPYLALAYIQRLS